jgi:type VI secretion system secreted protein Hcp
MMQRTILLAAIFMAFMALSSRGEAAAFIKFDGVDGEAQDKDHKGWSDILSFSQVMHRSAGTDPTRPRGAVVMEELVVVKELDKSTPKLAEALTRGQHFPKVEIHLTASYTEGERVTYFAYELKNVQVTSYSISGSGRSQEVPTESMSLNFEEIKVTYTEYDKAGAAKGNVEYEWKIEEGTAALPQTNGE